MMKQRLPLVAAVVLISVIIDQVTKWAAVAQLKGEPEIRFLGGIFRLTYAENPGAFLSFGAYFSDTARFYLFIILVGFFLLFALRHVLYNPEVNRAQMWALSLLIGGGIGNLIDRVAYGYVIDFLFMGYSYVRTGVFNVADMAIMAAVIFFIYEGIADRFKKQPAKEA